MRVFLVALLSIIILSPSYGARIEACPNTTDTTTCNKAEGCWLSAGSCQPCDSGTYWTSDKGCQKCPDTHKNSSKGSTSINECYAECKDLTKTIDFGTWYRDATTVNHPSLDCFTNQNNITCTENATRSGSTCTCDTHFVGSADKTICEPKIYKITLNNNCTTPCTVKEKPAYEQYGQGFSFDKPDGPFVAPSDFKIDLDAQATKRWFGIEFKGYTTVQNNATTRLIDENGALLSNSATLFKVPTTLYALWNSMATITYKQSGKDDDITNCDIDKTCNIKAAPTCGNGDTWKGWKCTNGCTEQIVMTANQPLMTYKDKLDQGKAINIELTAQCEPCPVGYYCPNNTTKTKCPLGATSKGKATAITDCYIKRGAGKSCDEAKDATCFCDNDGCFTLPGTGNIKYSGS